MDKKMISPDIEWCIGIFPGLCTIFFKTSTGYLEFLLYYAVNLEIFGYFILFSFLCPTYALGALNGLFEHTLIQHTK